MAFVIILDILFINLLTASLNELSFHVRDESVFFLYFRSHSVSGTGQSPGIYRVNGLSLKVTGVGVPGWIS